MGSPNTRSGYGCVGLGKSRLYLLLLEKALTPGPSSDGTKDRDGRCGQYVPSPKNLQAETNMDYRNDCVDWFAFRGFGDSYGSFFGVYIKFISYLILRMFALLS